MEAFRSIFFLAAALFTTLHAVVAEDNSLFFDWTVSYSIMAPLGVEKRVITINDQFPGPLLNTTTNDVVHVNVRNNLTDPFLLTWNGVQTRKNSWNDGVQGTNCPVPPGQNWTYVFQVKDVIGSFFYFPSIGLDSAAGGYGPVRINNRVVIPIPFDFPSDDFDILIGDWFNADHKNLSALLDQGHGMPSPDGILINGLRPYEANFTFQEGSTYRLRISNVGLKTSLNFAVLGHKMLLVEAEGSYTLKQYYNWLHIHPGQSYSVLVTADQRSDTSYYIIASSLFGEHQLTGIANLHYNASKGAPSNFILDEESLTDDYNLTDDYSHSMAQARSIRWDLAVGAARPNPQGSYHYGSINITRTIVLQNGAAVISNLTRYTINGVSFSYPSTPLKLADYFKIPNVFTVGAVSDKPDERLPSIDTPVIDARYRDFIEIVFQNNESSIQTWHIDGYSFFVVGMDWGIWNEEKQSQYNLVDGIYRATVQVYPFSWTAILMSLDDEGMWNIRSQDVERRYLGQEVYMRVRGDNPSVLPSPRDELPIPSNVLKCGKLLSAPEERHMRVRI